MLLGLVAIGLLFLLLFSSPVSSTPFTKPTMNAVKLAKKQYEPGDVPFWDSSIPSCNICEPDWSGIDTCAKAAPVFQSITQILWNPVEFVDTIKCACTDTFQSAYPQCVDCFVQTKQCPQFLGVPSEAGASSIIDGIRQVYGFGSALLGGVASADLADNITYTYNGVPDQGYPTTTSYGPGGIDLGSSEGAGAGVGLRASLSQFGLLLLVAAVTLLCSYW